MTRSKRRGVRRTERAGLACEKTEFGNGTHRRNEPLSDKLLFGVVVAELDLLADGGAVADGGHGVLECARELSSEKVQQDRDRKSVV